MDVPIAASNLLTLSDAIHDAVNNSPAIQSALSRVRAAQAEVDQAGLLPNPILSIGLRFPEAGAGNPIIQAGLTADLILLLQRPGRISAADNRLRQASFDALSTALDVLSEVQESYAAVQSLDAMMPVLEERQKLIDHLVELAQARLRNGEATQLDVTVARTQKVELEVEIVEKRLERKEARLSLAHLIGRPSGSADWQVEPWRELGELGASESDWVAAALKHRPEIQARRYELAALGAEAKLAGMEVFEAGSAGIDAERDGEWSIGPAVAIPLPFFDWGQAGRDRAKARVIEARHELTKIQREIVESVRAAYSAFSASRDALHRVRTELVPLQQQRRDQAEAAYLAGQTDITSLVLADQDLQSARARLIELERRTSSSAIELQRAVGGPAAAWAVDPASTRPATRNVKH